jgi:hypothetical protein
MSYLLKNGELLHHGYCYLIPLCSVETEMKYLVLTNFFIFALLRFGTLVLAFQPYIRHRKDIRISKDISYPISKNLQKGYFLSFFGAGYFEDIISDILFLGISKYHIHILSYILFSTFSARDFGFQRQD